MTNYTLSNFQIDKYLKQQHIKNYKGCFYRDGLPSVLSHGFYVINLDDGDYGGTHWTCLYYVNKKTSIYFDSYGFPAPEDIEAIIGEDYTYSHKEIQDIDATTCGYFVIAFILYMYKENNLIKRFKSFLRQFINAPIQYSEINDKKLFSILYKMAKITPKSS